MSSVERLTYGGHELVYETHGSGPRVTVLVHGLLLDAHLSRALAMALAGSGAHQVVLLELLGHGRSDRPVDPSLHRIDSYAQQVVALLDHLEVDEAVIGGTSLGANVALQAAAAAPERVRGLILEMPVLEWAGPAAAALFVPLLLGVRFGRPVAELVTAVVRRLPRTRIGPLDTFLNAASMRPAEIAAVLHGIVIGPLAPRVDERRVIQVPSLIVGHRRDALHPFSDAEHLAEQLPNDRLIRARSAFELRTRPTRLTGEICAFLDEVWRPQVAGGRSARSR